MMVYMVRAFLNMESSLHAFYYETDKDVAIDIDGLLFRSVTPLYV